ncbi:MAG: MBL fold metallo-hydrolase [Maricaulis sp.]|uniref:MBL fold metallo-hydrolase n=1 Tax=Maricaulis sp. TaxID=1486257 RepID=UPI001B043F32|nr:MBL fold metallo-hydrolase [Maricaulis sp.]MBO6847290.1 pyrroloquinoline quinone biosynthesis protein PqqB [Maricaulis sp.]MBO6876511.1 pyrroloquinoline quinone biosynthesis protein PqqB [Maricaulis sp.]MDM7983163.1 MBL fold metallo-hydrolase [Maricaulis sp.]
MLSLIASLAIATLQPDTLPVCTVELVVLGVAQDAGAPQIGNSDDPAWQDPSLRRLASSVAVVNRQTGERVLFDATPDLREQLYRLDQFMPVETTPGLDGIFLTHGHMGHYTGLMFLGFESMGARDVPVYAMPDMANFLFSNGPWEQLVRYDNIELEPLEASIGVEIAGLTVTPFLVPHRQEYTEVVGFSIDGPDRSALFLPDIDSWEEWDEEGTRIEDMIASVDVAYLDATFFANGEIPGRDMSGFPHPFITHSMARFADLPATEKAKVRFIHFNHTNPVRFPDSPERQQVLDAGFGLADEGERYCLGD